MNSENSEKSDPHRVLLNITDKKTWNGKTNILLYQTLLFTIHEKIIKSHIRKTNLKHQLQNGMKKLNYLMDHILYKIFKIILGIYWKSS